jgi:hypothetical protein
VPFEQSVQNVVEPMGGRSSIERELEILTLTMICKSASLLPVGCRRECRHMRRQPKRHVAVIVTIKPWANKNSWPS